MSILVPRTRTSFMKWNEIYFRTSTIHNWEHLLANDSFKEIIIESWQYLADINKIDVFGFVIMPNHVHSIWRSKGPNGNESTQGSFLKYTAHQFLKKLKSEPAELSLSQFKVTNIKKHHQFWQRDPLAIPIYTREVAIQKLNYIHNNPLKNKWSLVNKSSDYKFSSASFYEKGQTEFKFLKSIWKNL